MPKPKRKPYEKKSFESSGVTSDISSNIYMSMMLSEAWKHLSKPQQVLYLYCKAQYYAEKRKPNNDQLCFTMNQVKWSSLYNIYIRSNAKGFYRDMSALIKYGFVICLDCGAHKRVKSIYTFSSMWQKFGTDQFKVLPDQMTNALQHREYPEIYFKSAVDLKQQETS